MRRIWVFLAASCLLLPPVRAQRVYATASSMASGSWYRIAVSAPGVYKVDAAVLRSLGVNVTGLASAGIRLYGNGGGVLSEPCNGPYMDDLRENAIDIEDGGDGIFNEGDYFLFYTPGPHHWIKDSVNRRFTHIKNIYSELTYYFINIGGGGGRRIAGKGSLPGANVAVTSFDWRAFHELDTVNVLSSGKDWYGEEFSNIPGGVSSRVFTVTPPHAAGGVVFSTVCMARSVGASSRMSLSVNGSAAGALDLPAVTDGSYDVFGRAARTAVPATPTSMGSIAIGLQFTPGGYNAQGWLDWWELSGRGILSLEGFAQLQCRDWSSVGSGRIGAFSLQGADAATRVWDVTDPGTPLNMQGELSGSVFSWNADAGSLHEYVAFNISAKALPVAAGKMGAEGAAAYPYGGTNGDPNGADLGAQGLFTPLPLGKVDNQNLHQPAAIDLLIISDPALSGQAQRLAQFHQQHDRLRTLVVNSNQVYNEFSGGTSDPTALRDYVKMFYDRSGGDSTKRPRYLLLFGSGSFDYKDRLSGNTNKVPVYESGVSLDPLNTYTSDDYFGMLQDAADVNAIDRKNLLDIAIGRIPARTPAEASAVVDKILHYADVKTQGPWRNVVTLVADDGDQNLHFQDAETFAGTIGTGAPAFNENKIYLDAYKQQNTPAGGRYPDVNQAISSGLYNGTLIWNYTGHGSNSRLSNEDVMDQSTVAGFSNPDKLPLFITATCDFAPHDNPLIQSIGAGLLVRPGSGAVALMTTTRLVFAFSNKVINNNYLQLALTPRPDGTYYPLGEAGRLTKNYTYQTQTDAVNNRKFTLLGDPAMTLAFPVYKVKTSAINGKAVGGGPGAAADTLKALNQVSVAGSVTDVNGGPLAGFNGVLYATVYDKPRMATTLGNNSGSYRAEFQVQDNILYKGKVSVSQGNFSFSFVVPKDINYQYGKGKISYYAGSEGGTSGGGGADGKGVFTDVIVGGSGNGTSYTGGPAIQAYLNDEKFVDGGITGANPILLLHLQDSLGINITGTSIGHDITAVLDNNTQNPLVLNGFYEADLNTFKKGTVRYPLPHMTEGEHVLLIKAWNVAGNSGQTSLSFRVVASQRLALTHVLNYPNPFTTHTTFWFEHNRAGEDLSVLVQILTVSGKLVKSIRRTINTPGNRSSEIDWDGRDDYGAKIGRGVYIYRLRVRSTDGSTVDVFQKLYIL
ncbi:MAG: type IX secretion system sortase PorU [Chitinophagaceae bacterium]|nr:type IX secretion system sortase PorU [Chitinophagaceae bacterium]